MQRDAKDSSNPLVRQPIVVGVDGSANSRLALKWAADEADRRGSVLRIMYSESDGPKDVPSWYAADTSDLTPAEAIIDDAAGLVATRHPSMMARGEIVDWPPSLVLTVASRSADLLVVGARGLGGFEELLIGSVSDQCLQYAHCPVAVVHCDADDIPYQALQPRIVVGIDGSLGSTRALQWALEEAVIRSASVEAVYAWQYPPIGTFAVRPAHSEQFVREVVEAAAEYAGRSAPEVPFTSRTTCTPTVPALLDACQGADLLVVGSRGHGRVRDGVLGSVAHQCARHARCTVVVARPRLEARAPADAAHGPASHERAPEPSVSGRPA